VVPEPLPERCKQPVAVHNFFLAHLFEHLRRRRVGLPQRVRKFPVDAAIFFFRRDGQRQNLFFRQIFEFF
jgi:hypothetical protein